MDTKEFLETVITTEVKEDEKAYFCLASGVIDKTDEETRKTWREEFFLWPDSIENIVERISTLDDDRNIYFSPYLFSSRDSNKNSVLPSRTIVADLDDANVLTLPLKPTILVESSPARHQGYWILKEELPLKEHEALSRKLTYSIPRCDRTGWFAGKKVRVPGTMNLKYATGKKFVRVIDVTGFQYNASDLEGLPTLKEMYGNDAEKFEIDEENFEWVGEAQKLDIGPIELLTSIRSSLPSRIIHQYHIPAVDRSIALWALMCAAFRAGLLRDKVFYLAMHSANNKFLDLKYGGIRELAKDVLRAELAVKIKLPDVKSKILEARRMEVKAFEISRYISDIVIEHLKKIGSFIHTIDDNTWFVREDTGRPIIINPRSEQLEVLIDTFFGLNSSEKEYNYTVRSLASHVRDMPVYGQVGALSYYDPETQMFLLHTGRKDVLNVTKNSINQVTNGYNGIIFPWNVNNSAISPNYKALDKTWEDELFEGCFDNLLDLSPNQAKAIIKIWFISVLMREGLVSRPILACFGQPGAGKSMLFRRIYTLMYGKDRSLNAVTKEEDFDYAVVGDPLVVLDNVDTAHKWLPDKLAISAAPSEWTKRKLFTDTDTITLRRQAMIALTAHAPKFGREDVTDRLLLLTFERLQYFQSETHILDRILKMRNVLWGEILKDIQKILNTKVPISGWPQFRVEDFAKFGYWIGTALNCAEDFTEGIEQITRGQKLFVLEEDGILVDALQKMILADSKRDSYPFRTPSQLMGILPAYSNEDEVFTKRYNNAVMLGKKLWTLQNALNEIFDIKFDMNKSKGTRTWRIAPKLEVRLGIHNE